MFRLNEQYLRKKINEVGACEAIVTILKNKGCTENSSQTESYFHYNNETVYYRDTYYREYSNGDGEFISEYIPNNKDGLVLIVSGPDKEWEIGYIYDKVFPDTLITAQKYKRLKLMEKLAGI